VARKGQDHVQVPHPRVVFLTNDAIASDRLAGWIDALSADKTPLILCVGASDTAAPVAESTLTQRRIDLLAIEQNAWVLAARDTRCIVVETRTELDWAMKNGEITVWAPSKIVLDSAHRPSAGPRDPLALAGWFAEEMKAAELVVIGAEVPQVSVPGRSIPLGAAK
jgi:dihydroneopterin aldolase